MILSDAGSIPKPVIVKGGILFSMFCLFAELSGLRDKSWRMWLSFPKIIHIGICIITTMAYFKFIQKPLDVYIEGNNDKK